MRFSDQTPQWDYIVDSNPDPTFYNADTNDATLEDFFKRPIKIRSYNWAIGTPLMETFNPWTDYYENTRVLNRISNYNLLRSKLCIRIVINGNGFHYGRAIASYLPLPEVDNFTRNRSIYPQDIIACSQRPHVYLDPTTSQGGSLCLPYVYFNNALRIPQMDWRKMGEMNIRTINELKHANGAVDNVTISVFAWAEEVSLSIPTAGEPGALSPQAGDDEYGMGVVSRPANIAAKVAGSLSMVPTIGPYARATQMAMGTVAKIASAFGFSRPASLAEVIPQKPTFFGNIATANMLDTSQKLTLDAKQELTIDPRVMGLGSSDELSIKNIVTRESYLTTFGWSVSDTTEQLLWNSFVGPALWDNAQGREVHLPACGFAAMPFKHWKGTMKFRFQIVASTFHKGRLKITFDPYYQKTNEYNVCYTHIIDLAKERDFTIDVGWGQGQSFLNVARPSATLLPFEDSTNIGPDNNSFWNGVISAYVVNDLTIPNSIANNNIEVNVFVSGGDDMEFVNPDSDFIQDTSYFFLDDPAEGQESLLAPQSCESLLDPQADETSPDSTLTVDESEPMKMVATDHMAAKITDTDNTQLVFFGDPVNSFRQCLKRYNYHTYIPKTVGGYSWMILRNSDFPAYRGHAPGAVNVTALGEEYNYCKTTLANYLTPAYTCVRGGMRWKYMRDGGTNTSNENFFQLTRKAEDNDGYLLYEESALTNTIGNAAQRISQNTRLIPHTWDGATVTSVSNNPVLEGEIPFQTSRRFFPSKSADKTVRDFNTYHTLTSMWNSGGSTAPGIHSYVSVAEDFNLGFFTGAPVLYIRDQSNDPTA